ncbi:M56 family metallopeptidase [Anaerotignum sp.]|uniref:M56 family metallopeptidase n=1 Tax=Anaerotignum sp. TaxID=2039241 RepID=UPI002A91430B|nr:M56 family metallopeptidase [Anaerotignum sp.]MDY5415073.1 M56 family metallopeptidase [Anaerotignum sp.]
MIRHLFSMSTSASIVFILWMFSYFVYGKKCTAKWNYTMLKIGLFFAVCPVCIFFPFEMSYVEKINHQTQTIISRYPILDTMTELNSFSWLLVLWLIGGISVLFYKVRIYYKIRYQILDRSYEINDLMMIDAFLSCQEQVGIKTKIELRVNPFIQTPLVIGVIRPIILLPENYFRVEDLRFIFLHEMFHIKNKDLWFRYISMISLILHWYNPFIYLLNKNLLTYSEFACDESVVSSMSKSERAKYGSVILNMAAFVPAVCNESFVTFSSKRNLKKRLEYLIQVKKMKKSMKYFSRLIGIAVVFCGVATTIFVYGMYNTQHKILEHNEEWIGPFESTSTTVYDLGDGYTAVEETQTTRKIKSLSHSDKKMFTPEQWSEILKGIEDGSIVWND